MFKRSYRASKDRAGKSSKVAKHSFRDDCAQRLRDQLAAQAGSSPDASPSMGGGSPQLTSVIYTLVVGKDQRLFAAHEDVLSRSPWFARVCQSQYFSPPGERNIMIPDEEPEIISAILEYLYKGDYTPRLVHDKKRDVFKLEDMSPVKADDPALSPRSETSGLTSKKVFGPSDLVSVFHHGVGDYVLRDTVIYCTASRYGLPDLQRLALRKQGMHSGIDVAIVLRSMRFAYANTPLDDARLRAHFLALIIRSRKTFKHSGTMQMEMEKGGSAMFFDLFVAMCHHMDELQGNATGRSPVVDK